MPVTADWVGAASRLAASRLVVAGLGGRTEPQEFPPMRVSFRVDSETGAVYITTRESPSIDEQREVWEQIVAHPDVRLPLRVLDDRRAQGEIADSSEVRSAARIVGKMLEMLRGARIAAVVPRAAAYGMSRMFQIYADELPLELRAFYEIEEATRWIFDGDDA